MFVCVLLLAQLFVSTWIFSKAIALNKYLKDIWIKCPLWMRCMHCVCQTATLFSHLKKSIFQNYHTTTNSFGLAKLFARMSTQERTITQLPSDEDNNLPLKAIQHRWCYCTPREIFSPVKNKKPPWHEICHTTYYGAVVVWDNGPPKFLNIPTHGMKNNIWMLLTNTDNHCISQQDQVKREWCKWSLINFSKMMMIVSNNLAKTFCTLMAPVWIILFLTTIFLEAKEGIQRKVQVYWCLLHPYP